LGRFHETAKPDFSKTVKLLTREGNPCSIGVLIYERVYCNSCAFRVSFFILVPVALDRRRIDATGNRFDCAAQPEQPPGSPKEVAMTIEMHINGVPEAIFLRDKDADVFMSDYKRWITDRSQEQIFEFYHNGSIHCFALSSVAYLKVKMPTENQTRDLALAGSLLGSGGASVRH